VTVRMFGEMTVSGANLPRCFLELDALQDIFLLFSILTADS
jgi:hypothetical protein